MLSLQFHDNSVEKHDLNREEVLEINQIFISVKLYL